MVTTSSIADQDPNTAVPVMQSDKVQYATLAELNRALNRTTPSIDVLTETHLRGSFTDGGGASGTKVMTGTIPAGAIILGTKVVVGSGFIGDTSADLLIGDGDAADRYVGGNVDVFTTAAGGVQSGFPQGDLLQVAAVSPTLTVTSGSDFGLVTAGSVTVSIYYIRTVSL